MKKGFIINFTPNGMIPTKGMTPHVPITPREIIREVLDAAELGVSMVHLHARDPHSAEPTYKKEVYAEIIEGIRIRRKDLILCVSTSGRIHSDFEKRAGVLELDGDLKPDFASLTLSSLNFPKQASINPPETIQKLASRMLEKGIRPELEAFDLGMINYARYLTKKGFLHPPHYFNLILGNLASAQADFLHLALMIKELPEGSVWAVGGIGDEQIKMNIMSILSGGGIRVGIEDNIWYDEERTKLASNHELIKRVLSISESLGIQPYSPKEARDLLGI